MHPRNTEGRRPEYQTVVPRACVQARLFPRPSLRFTKTNPTAVAAAAGAVDGLPVEAVVDAVDGVHGLGVQGDEFALVLLDRRLLLVWRERREGKGAKGKENKPKKSEAR